MHLDSLHTAAISSFGGRASDYPNVIGAADGSRKQIGRARAALATQSPRPGVSALAVGSLGRHEALEASDLDFAVIYDPGVCDGDEAIAQLAHLVELLEAFEFGDISSKTFKDPMSLTELVSDVGGTNDSNLGLTYRALLLTEAAWLYNIAEGKDMADKIIGVYQSGLSTRGRFLTSLSNDLHRYYRTLCVDYRYKIEEDNKDWAIRNMKLRHSRKLWHLANLSLQCAAASFETVDEHDGMLAAHLSAPPLIKLVTAMERTQGLGLCADIWRLYDRFLGFIRDKSFRNALAETEHGRRDEFPEFKEIHDNAREFDLATQRVVEHLLATDKAYVIRYGIL